jgi:hypothetical protein
MVLLDQANPPKRCKVAQNSNERFINLAQVLAQANQEPEQCTRKTKSVIPEAVLVDKEGSSESEDLKLGSRQDAIEGQHSGIWSRIAVMKIAINFYSPRNLN